MLGEASTDYATRQAELQARRAAVAAEQAARLAAIPDADLAQQMTACTRAQYEAIQARAMVQPGCPTELHREYERRAALQQMPPIQMPTDIPAYQNFLTQRQIDDATPRGIFGWATGPFYTAFSTLRTGVYRAETATTLEKAKSLGLLAIPPAVGYMVYKKTQGNLGWSALLGLGAVAALPLLGVVLFYGIMFFGSMGRR
jgi:hypothetical protein